MYTATINKEVVLSGVLHPKHILSGTIKTKGSLEGKISIPTGTLITGTLVSSGEIFKSKTLSYSSKVESTQVIWGIDELDNFPITSLSDYEYISLTCVKTDNTHTTKQIVFSHSFYPYFKFSSSVVQSGHAYWHNSNTGGADVLRNVRELTVTAGGSFFINSNGINFEATTSYGLLGTYIFTLSAKLAA